MKGHAAGGTVKCTCHECTYQPVRPFFRQIRTVRHTNPRGYNVVNGRVMPKRPA